MYIHHTQTGEWLPPVDTLYIIGQCTHTRAFYFTDPHHYNFSENALLCMPTTKFSISIHLF